MNIEEILQTKLYHFGEVIGEGPYGKVIKITSRTDDKKYALKRVHCENDIKKVMKEIEKMTKYSFNKIVKYYEIYESINEIWIVVEYLPNGSIRDLFRLMEGEDGKYEKIFEENHISLITKTILKSLNYLHGKKIYHDNIKPSNFLFSQKGEVKLDCKFTENSFANFLVGISKLIAASIHPGESFVDKACYLAPEVITNDFDGEDVLKRDVWSLGISLIELCEGIAPFSDCHPLRQIFLIPQSPSPKLKHPENYSKDFNHFLKKCLTKDPKNRPSVRELLKHSFIRNCAKKNLLDIVDLIGIERKRFKNSLVLKKGGILHDLMKKENEKSFFGSEDNEESEDVEYDADSDSSDEDSESDSTSFEEDSSEDTPLTTTKPPKRSRSRRKKDKRNLLKRTIKKRNQTSLKKSSSSDLVLSDEITEKENLIDHRFLCPNENTKCLDVKDFVMNFRKKNIDLKTCEVSLKENYLEKEFKAKIEILKKNFTKKVQALEIWIKYLHSKKNK